MLLLMKGAWEIVLKRRVERNLIQERRWFELTEWLQLTPRVSSVLPIVMLLS